MFSGKALSTARKPVELTDICDLITSTGAVKTTTKKWEQSANCATWRVPANGVYFIAGQIGNFNDSSWLDYLQGRIEIGNRVVAYAGQQSVPTNTKNCIQISTIQKLNEGDVIRMDPWTDMAGCTVETQLHIVRILNLSGGGCLKLIYSVASLIGGFHVFGNRKGERKDVLGAADTNANPISDRKVCSSGGIRSLGIPDLSWVLSRTEWTDDLPCKAEHRNVLSRKAERRYLGRLEESNCGGTDLLDKRCTDDELFESRKPDNAWIYCAERGFNNHSWLGGVAVCR